MPHILAHLYHASKKSKDPAFLYGSVFPDNLILLKKRHSSALKFAGKLSRKNKKYKLFYQGVKNHIELDNKFHKKILPSKLRKIKKKFNNKISTDFAHTLIELALDSNLHKNKSKEINELLPLFYRFNNKEVMYYLSIFLKKSETFIDKFAETLLNFLKLSTKFSIRSLLKRAKILEKYFEKEVKKNASFIKDLFRFIKVWKYSKELTKDYQKYI